MKKISYFIDSYRECGSMPLYLVLFHDSYIITSHYAMICKPAQLKQLLHEKPHKIDPKQYGRIIFSSHEPAPNEELKSILQTRYYFDLDQAPKGENFLA